MVLKKQSSFILGLHCKENGSTEEGFEEILNASDSFSTCKLDWNNSKFGFFRFHIKKAINRLLRDDIRSLHCLLWLGRRKRGRDRLLHWWRGWGWLYDNRRRRRRWRCYILFNNWLLINSWSWHVLITEIHVLINLSPIWTRIYILLQALLNRVLILQRRLIWELQLRPSVELRIPIQHCIVQHTIGPDVCLCQVRVWILFE